MNFLFIRQSKGWTSCWARFEGPVLKFLFLRTVSVMRFECLSIVSAPACLLSDRKRNKPTSDNTRYLVCAIAWRTYSLVSFLRCSRAKNKKKKCSRRLHPKVAVGRNSGSRSSSSSSSALSQLHPTTERQRKVVARSSYIARAPLLPTTYFEWLAFFFYGASRLRYNSKCDVGRVRPPRTQE